MIDALRPIKHFLRLISPEKAAFDAMSIERALWRIEQRGMAIGTVVDIGASNGAWSAVCQRHFPSASYLLIEANPGHREALEQFCRSRKNTAYVLAVAGDDAGDIHFNDQDLSGGQATRSPTADHRSVMQQTTVDIEVASRGLPAPYMLKLDTHGYEIPILNGAADTLKNASLVIVEVYNFKISAESLLFHELISAMNQRGFGVIDISEPLWRKKDKALWSFDLAFVPLNRPEFAYLEYR